MYRNKSKKNSGITLIALIITIIVMLILVAVTISMAINGGLFEKAGEAVGDTKKEINREQQLGIGSIVDQYVYNISEEVASLPTYSEELLDETTVLTTNAKFISGNQVAVVPKGFKIVEGLNGSTSIADGLVIQDVSGNEFVWIPVTYTKTNTDDNENGYDDGFDAVFYRSEWSNNARGTSLMDSTTYTEPYASGYTNEDGTTEIDDYNAMVQSVYKNGGFYIGRYEAGSTTPRTDKANGTTSMVVKRDAYPYNYVGWGLTMSDYTSDVTYSSKNQGKGALYLSKHMYDGEDIGATSTLCYGIQWDAMLDFIKEEKNVTSSTSWGNFNNNLWTITRKTAQYSENHGETWILIDDEEDDKKEKTKSSNVLLTTGADNSFAAKNIFDVAGNVYEWTNEAWSGTRVYHGGMYFYNGIGSISQSSDRAYNNVFVVLRTTGFRPVLYIP